MQTLGVHGSCDGILKGRGRSPQNWALLMGKTSFDLSIFKISKGVDSGAILATKKVYLDDKDSIFDSYLKCSLTSAGCS